MTPRKSYEPEGQARLKSWFIGAKRIVIAGIGNPIRKDDFAGVKIVEKLKGKTCENVLLLECETVPESFTQCIVDFAPTHVLLIDAAVLELKPGQSRLIEPAELTLSTSLSSHTLPLRIFCEQVSKMSKAKVGLLLIQPKNTDFGEGLSLELEDSAKEISETLLQTICSAC